MGGHKASIYLNAEILCKTERPWKSIYTWLCCVRADLDMRRVRDRAVPCTMSSTILRAPSHCSLVRSQPPSIGRLAEATSKFVCDLYVLGSEPGLRPKSSESKSSLFLDVSRRG